MTPLVAKHVDADGKIMATIATGYHFQLQDWLKTLTIEPGDRIEFDTLHVRKQEEAAPTLSVVTA